MAKSKALKRRLSKTAIGKHRNRPVEGEVIDFQRLCTIRESIVESDLRLFTVFHKLATFGDFTQVGFAELKETADYRANIGGTIIGAPIVGQQLAIYILTDRQDVDYRSNINSQNWADRRPDHIFLHGQ